MPIACATATARAVSTSALVTTRPASSPPPLAQTPSAQRSKDAPSIHSMTRSRASSLSGAERSDTMFGWASAESTAVSRAKRVSSIGIAQLEVDAGEAASEGSSPSSVRISRLIATRRPVRGSIAS